MDKMFHKNKNNVYTYDKFNMFQTNFFLRAI